MMYEKILNHKKRRLKMKKNLLTKVILVTITVITLTSIGYSATDTSFNDVKLTKASIENLKLGIKLDNEGVRKCCIYFVGKYKISELKEDLIDQFKKEENPRIRILIALSLYQLEDSESIELLKIFAEADQDQEVKRICAAIYNEYWKNDIQGNIQISISNLLTYSISSTIPMENIKRQNLYFHSKVNLLIL